MDLSSVQKDFGQLDDAVAVDHLEIRFPNVASCSGVGDVDVVLVVGVVVGLVAELAIAPVVIVVVGHGDLIVKRVGHQLMHHLFSRPLILKPECRLHRLPMRASFCMTLDPFLSTYPMILALTIAR